MLNITSNLPSFLLLFELSEPPECLASSRGFHYEMLVFNNFMGLQHDFAEFKAKPEAHSLLLQVSHPFSKNCKQPLKNAQEKNACRISVWHWESASE